MPKSQVFSNDLMKAILQGIGIANLLDNAASGPITTLYISLHTADPGTSGDQTVNEVAYSGYSRVAIARSAVGWTVTDAVGTNAAAISFSTCTSGNNTIMYAAVGTAASGAGKLLYSGSLTAPLQVSAGITPIVDLGTFSVTES